MIKKSIILLLIFVGQRSVADNDSTSFIRAVRVMAGPRVDGKLSDSCWIVAGKTAGFIQKEPDMGKPCTEKTVVYCVYDNTHIYFAFDCFTSEPNMVERRLVPRESGSYGDYVVICLDTYYDKRTCYKFLINAAGVQSDCRAIEDGKIEDYSFDGVWESKAVASKNGWIVEVGIPFRILRFSGSKEQIWGVNFARYIKRKNEIAYWVPPSEKDAWTHVSKFRNLKGISDITPGKHIEILPYTTVRSEKPSDKNIGLGAGGNLKWKPITNVAFDFTVLPDFAQVEADPEYINLSKYEIYLGERRPFFMENSLLFETPLKLFYSRRIGKRFWDGTEVNIDGGAKITGKIKRTDFGLLRAKTPKTFYNDSRNIEPEAFYSVIRVKQDIFKNSTFGVLITDKDTMGSHNRVFGTDANLSFLRSLVFRGQAATTYDNSQEDNLAYHLELGYYSDKFRGGINYRDIGKQFDANAVGFVPWTGEKNRTIWGGFYPRPMRFNIKQIFIGMSYVGQKEYIEPKWTTGTGIYGNVFFLNDWQVGLKVIHSHGYEQNISYINDLYKVHLASDIRKPITFRGYFTQWYGFNYRRGLFGHFRDEVILCNAKLRDDFLVTVNIDFVEEYDDDWSFIESIWVVGEKMKYSFTKELYIRTYFQQNTDIKRYTFNVLLGYEYLPGSILYLGYNESRDNSEGNMRIEDQIIFFKISYLWNL